MKGVDILFFKWWALLIHKHYEMHINNIPVCFQIPICWSNGLYLLNDTGHAYFHTLEENNKKHRIISFFVGRSWCWRLCMCLTGAAHITLVMQRELPVMMCCYSLTHCLNTHTHTTIKQYPKTCTSTVLLIKMFIHYICISL